MILDIKELAYFGLCTHSHIGKMYTRGGWDISCKLVTGGNLLIGPIYGNGWKLSCALAKGRIVYRNGYVNTKLILNGKEVSIKKIKKLSFDVGDLYGFRGTVGKYMRVDQSIKRALKKNKSPLTYEEIINSLELRKDYINRPLRYTGNNIWICSMAIGIAKGKKIFCLPWLNIGELKCQVYRLNLMAKVAESIDGILIVPVEEGSIMKEEIIWKSNQM